MAKKESARPSRPPTKNLEGNRDDIKGILAFCERWLAAWSGNRPAELIRFFAPDAFYSDPARRQGLRGRDQILAYFQKLLAVNPHWQWRALEVFPTAAGFTLKWEAVIPVGGRVVIEQGLDIVELERGLIARNEVYFDRSRLPAPSAK